MNVADFSFSLLWFHVSCFLTRSRTEVIWTRWRPPTWPLCLVPICCGPETSRRACSPSLGSTTSQSSSSSIRIWYSPSDGWKSDDDQGAKTDIIQDFVISQDFFLHCDEGIRSKMAGQVAKRGLRVWLSGVAPFLQSVVAYPYWPNFIQKIPVRKNLHWTILLQVADTVIVIII